MVSLASPIEYSDNIEPLTSGIGSVRFLSKYSVILYCSNAEDKQDLDKDE